MAEGHPDKFDVFLFRHAEAAKAAEGMKDADRQLTPKGIEQAKAAKLRVPNTCHQQGTVTVFSSPALRAREIASIVFPEVPILIEDVLMPFDATLDKAFAEYGYDLAKYVANPAVHTHLSAWAAKARRTTIGRMISKGGLPKPGDTIALFGHAITHNFLACEFSKGFGVQKTAPDPQALTYELPEAGSFHLQFDDVCNCVSVETAG